LGRFARHPENLPDAETHRPEAGHFAVEDSLNEIASGMHGFYADKVVRKATQQANA
jgi:hypothetical protein